MPRVQCKRWSKTLGNVAIEMRRAEETDKDDVAVSGETERQRQAWFPMSCAARYRAQDCHHAGAITEAPHRPYGRFQEPASYAQTTNGPVQR